MPTGYARGWALLRGMGDTNRTAYTGEAKTACSARKGGHGA